MPFIVAPRQFTQRAELYHQLAQLISAGIGLVPALEQVAQHPPSHSFHKPLGHLLTELKEGHTFSEAMYSGSWFPAFDVALLEAGEHSGRLDACFRLLSDYYNDRARITKQVISQLIYPVGLIHFAALVFLIILPFAHSQFKDNPLWLFVRAALVLAPFYAVTIALIYAMQGKHGERWRAGMEMLLRPIPILGAARHSLALSRLAAALEALLSAGVNIIEAWELAATASGSPALRRAVESWKPQVVAGQTPAEAVRLSPQFPELFSNLYASGEISGKLDDSLRRLYSYYNEEGTRKLHAFAQWTPRLIYFIVAGIIAYEVIHSYIGYFNQISTITNGF
jgi:type IV pilus assembly protein PilC